MGDVHPLTNAAPDFAESPPLGDQEVMERAITKLVLLGKQVGVDADEMIVLLGSGLSVLELVGYIAARTGQGCCD